MILKDFIYIYMKRLTSWWSTLTAEGGSGDKGRKDEKLVMVYLRQAPRFFEKTETSRGNSDTSL